MLLGRSSTRARNNANRSSRGSRGQGSTSRGAKNSSSSPSASSSTNSFEQERAENAAKRAQRAQNSTTVNGRGGRGGSRGTLNNKQVRFAGASSQPDTSSAMSTTTSDNPFAPKPASPAFGTPAATSSSTLSNPFAPKPASTAFGAPAANPSSFNPFAPMTTTPPAVSTSTPSTTTLNPFGAPSQPARSSGVFGLPSSTSSNPFAKPSASVFDTSSTPGKNPFGAPSTQPSPFGAPSSQINGAQGFATSSKPLFSSTPTTTSSFTSPKTQPVFGSAVEAKPPAFGQPQNSFSNNLGSFGGTFSTSMSGTPQKDAASSKAVLAPKSPPRSPDSLGEKIRQVLQIKRIYFPNWPKSPPQEGQRLLNNPTYTSFIKAYKDCREKARVALIQAGLIDDPNKPKKLSEALDFKGTCEELCPEFEKIDRMIDGRVDTFEKDVLPNGSLSQHANPQKMVKALARSAAGQDAPLPSDVRTVKALKRSLDYLINDVLGNNEIAKSHTFLWDRTRAIRRDFVFHSFMTPTELLDQVDCLERIVRFHAVALHQMVKSGPDTFSEQQEIEQLGKAILSLMHAYEDCKAQGVTCDNEIEFRSYYILLNAHNPGILGVVQDWDWSFWGESEQIQLAVLLVETLQNTWNVHGPLAPHVETDMAQNGFARFFNILEDNNVSYIMACLAEIFFKHIRKAFLKTILTSFRMQREQTKDWTPERLNAFLRFDSETDVIPFCEAHQLCFAEHNGQQYLSFDRGHLGDAKEHWRQQHSTSIVEKKRGNRSLPEVINTTVYGDDNEEDIDDESDGGLFVKDGFMPPFPKAVVAQEEIPNDFKLNQSASTTIPSTNEIAIPQEILSKPQSIFDRISGGNSFGGDFFSKPVSTEQRSVTSLESNKPDPSIFGKNEGKETTSIFAPAPKDTSNPTPPFSFLNKSTAHESGGRVSAPVPSASKTSTSVPTTSSPSVFFGLNQSATNPPVSFPVASIASEPLPQLQEHTPQSKPQRSFFPITQSPSLREPVKSTPPPTFLPQTPSQVPTEELIVKSTPPPPPTTLTSGFTPASEPAAFKAQPTFSVKPAPVVRKPPPITAFNNWMTLGEGGIIEQFTEHQVEQLLRQTVELFAQEETARIAREEEEADRLLADNFRSRKLATQYGAIWRRLTRRMFMRRQARMARDLRKELAEARKASKLAEKENIVEDFKASVKRSIEQKAASPTSQPDLHRRRDSLESLLDATGVMNGVHDSDQAIRSVTRRDQTKSTTKRQRSERSASSQKSGISKHKRGKSENPLRRSLMSDPSYMSGESRIYHMPHYTLEDENRRQVSGVKTDYFRLKARGITTLFNGTPLASSAAKEILHHKRSFDDFKKPSTPQRITSELVAKSVPAKSSFRPQIVHSDEEIQALKLKAKKMVAEDKEKRELAKKRKSMDEEDEELFARAKRIREQMDEGEKWFNKVREGWRKSDSRSQSQDM